MTLNSAGRFSVFFSRQFTLIGQVFVKVRVFVRVLFKRARSKSTVSLLTDTTGFAPRHYIGIITGFGLSFINTTS